MTLLSKRLVTGASGGLLRRLDEVKDAMIEEWSRTKRAPKHAA